jgi:hypothetical protein
MREEGQGVILGASAERTATRSATPFVYVPRRFRIGGIEGIQTGAAIVGTPQGDGMVAIEVEARPDVEPNPEVWTTWVSDAAGRHVADEREPGMGKDRGTRFVSEAALIEVGRWIKGRVSIAEPAQGAELSRWIQAGRADYVVEAPFPHET